MLYFGLTGSYLVWLLRIWRNFLKKQEYILGVKVQQDRKWRPSLPLLVSLSWWLNHLSMIKGILSPFLADGLNPGASVFVLYDHLSESSLQRDLLVTDVSTTWAVVIFRVKWKVFVRWWYLCPWSWFWFVSFVVMWLVVKTNIFLFYKSFCLINTMHHRNQSLDSLSSFADECCYFTVRSYFIFERLMLTVLNRGRHTQLSYLVLQVKS